MAVTKTTYGGYVRLSGTLQEVYEALNDEDVPKHKIIKMADDGTWAQYSLY